MYFPVLVTGGIEKAKPLSAEQILEELQMPSVRYANDPSAALEAVQAASESAEDAAPAAEDEKKETEDDPLKAMMDAVDAESKK
jgi:hypothetical protein